MFFSNVQNNSKDFYKLVQINLQKRVPMRIRFQFEYFFMIFCGSFIIIKVKGTFIRLKKFTSIKLRYV